MSIRTKVIVIEPYNEKWKLEFERIRDMLNSYIGDLVLSIEHVGSTSVEGLSAKPIIDIDVVMDSYDDFPEIKKRLEEAGYHHEGNLGIEDREAFSYVKNRFMPYHLYVCPKDGKGYLEHIALRNHLRTNRDALEDYAALKTKLAKEYRYDADTYCERKTKFIQKILNKTLYSNKS
ncbi:GrpB family protein [Clostridium sp. UBA4395]|uniref:GrpB family protein n=1 Tax=Clostridium sp. UBA4395 TaxID=1946360 RepID=UPI000E9523CE|nr:hypothetical protein [Clostridium sp.]